MPGRSDSRRRHLALLAVMLVAMASLLARLAFWQIDQRDRLAALAFDQITVRQEEPARRGTIYDRTGTVVLATSVDRNRLVGNPDQLTPARRADVAARLVALLGLQGQLAANLSAAMGSDKAYVILAHGLEASVSDRIRAGLADGSLAGVSLEPETFRVYPQAGGAPNSTLAAQLLGFVNGDGVGQYGVEQRYQDLLAGRPTILVSEKNATDMTNADTAQVLDPGVSGVDLRLTIDAGLQLSLEQELFAAWIADRAKSVSAVVVDPQTGDVLAEGTYPSYDANQYATIATTKPSLFLDPVVSAVYEPGSVFKMLTAIAGLTAGVVTPTTRINDSGTLRLDGGSTRVDDADKKAMGSIEFQDVIAYSRNVGAARVALKLGRTTDQAAETLYQTWLRLGFGQPTGIDVSGEVGGLVNDPAVRQWRQIDLANGAFGQGVAVTPIQLATAYSAMVNGGTLVQPHVVAAVGEHDQSPAPKGQVIDSSLSPTLTAIMRHVVTTVPFYRDRTLVPGYLVGGKTGTAQIWDSKLNDWKPDLFNYSFVGYIGRDHPQAVVAVTIREGTPTILRQGHIEMPVMSFELFRRIATDTMTALDVPPGPKASPSPSATNR